jgi:hypothetical protein
VSECATRRRLVAAIPRAAVLSLVCACTLGDRFHPMHGAERHASPPAPEAAGDPHVLWRPTLGALQATWLAVVGVPTRRSLGDDEFPNKTRVRWKRATGGERAVSIDIALGRALPDHRARLASQSFRPTDARLVRSFLSVSGARAEVFHSDALAQVFVTQATPQAGSPIWFGTEPPGTFSEYLPVGARKPQPTLRSCWAPFRRRIACFGPITCDTSSHLMVTCQVPQRK